MRTTAVAVLFLIIIVVSAANAARLIPQSIIGGGVFRYPLIEGSYTIMVGQSIVYGIYPTKGNTDIPTFSDWKTIKGADCIRVEKHMSKAVKPGKVEMSLKANDKPISIRMNVVPFDPSKVELRLRVMNRGKIKKGDKILLKPQLFANGAPITPLGAVKYSISLPSFKGAGKWIGRSIYEITAEHSGLALVSAKATISTVESKSTHQFHKEIVIN